MADDLLIQKVVDGKIDKKAVSSTKEDAETRGTTKLGKDAFLQLLVAEMQNQDPLEPSSNTEWISQLATFSQLEELQSLSSTAENTQVFSLIGKQVVVTGDSPAGGKFTKSGVVDYITYSEGEAKFSIDGNLYSMENLSSVVGEDYYYEKNKPSVVEPGKKYTFDGDAPQDVMFEVNLGNDVAKAENVALTIGTTVIPSDYVVLNGNKVSLKAELLQELEPGEYSFDVVFDDKNYTTIKNAVSVTVFNPHKAKDDTTETANESNGQTEAANGTAGTSTEQTGASGGTGNEERELNGMKAGDLYGFDYDAVRALYPDLTDEEFEAEYGFLFEKPEE